MIWDQKDADEVRRIVLGHQTCTLEKEEDFFPLGDVRPHPSLLEAGARLKTSRQDIAARIREGWAATGADPSEVEEEILLRAQLQLDVVDCQVCLREVGGMTPLLRLALASFVEACKRPQGQRPADGEDW